MFFFFKQKTAYEIRNCDWSSDVCSSDLREGREARGVRRVDGKRRDGRGKRGDGRQEMGEGREEGGGEWIDKWAKYLSGASFEKPAWAEGD